MSKLKVWIGPELEGEDQGRITMFVKAEYPKSDYVIDYLMDYPECKRLYLGAGRTDVKEFPMSLIDYCDDNRIDIVVETTPAGLKYLPLLVLDSYYIILRMEVPEVEKLQGVDYMKIDTFKNVHICKLDRMTRTSLEELFGDTFNEDKIIFDGEAK